MFGACFPALLQTVFGWPPTWLITLISAAIGALYGFKIPDIWLSMVTRRRQFEIQMVLPDMIERSIPLIPNQTLYFIDAVSLDEAYAISAVLNSTIADALILAVAERAKDAHFRYFGRTIARVPLPSLDDPELVRLARRAHRNRGVGAELDQIVAKLYGVEERELEILRAFVDHRLAR